MTNDKQRVDFPVGENVREDKRGTPRERLVALINEAECESLNYEMANKFYPFDDYKSRSEVRADYLLENGVVVLPCKVGDKVWTKYGYTFEVEGIEILKDKKIFRCGNLGTDDYMAFFEDEIGKDVFFAKEEAEQALNNIQKGNSCEGGVQG
jgi:hypothetical protein